VISAATADPALYARAGIDHYPFRFRRFANASRRLAGAQDVGAADRFRAARPPPGTLSAKLAAIGSDLHMVPAHRSIWNYFVHRCLARTAAAQATSGITPLPIYCHFPPRYRNATHLSAAVWQMR
jgi:hypothetical protein